MPLAGMQWLQLTLWGRGQPCESYNQSSGIYRSWVHGLGLQSLRLIIIHLYVYLYKQCLCASF
jgi:hypothetical protein